MLTISHVSKYYGVRKILNNISLTIAKGEIHILVGRSGSGKSTLLKMINRLIEPDEGCIYLQGNDIKSLPIRQLRHSIGYAAQHAALFPHLTVKENILLALKLKKIPPEKHAAMVNDLLIKMNLMPQNYANRMPHELSGGEQHRVAIARALAGDPPYLLLDEPFAALDKITRSQLQQELLSLNQCLKKTILFVTHDMQEALTLADHISVFDKGKLLQTAKPAELIHHPADEIVNALVADRENDHA